MRITKAMIAAAEKHYACYEAIKWLRKKPRTLAQLANYEGQDGWQGWRWLEWALVVRGVLTGEARKEAKKLYYRGWKEIYG